MSAGERRPPRDLLAGPLRAAFPCWVGACVVVALFPLYVVAMVSVAPGAALFGERPALIVTAPTGRFWAAALAGGDLLPPLVKSLVVASATTAAAVLLAAPGAYAVARLPRRARHAAAVGILVTRMLPEFAVGVSVATHFARLGLVDSYAGLVLAHLVGGVPFVAWILIGAFEGIPRDLEAAASIDGASRLATLRRVILPVAAPAVAVAALFVWLYSWNEFLYARLLTTADNTLPLQVFQAIDRGTRQQMAAVAALLVLPALPVIGVLQRYLRPGALAGAIRG